MLSKPFDKLRGYDYPDPSIERGQTQPPNNGTPVLLSRENVEKFLQSLRDQLRKKHVPGG